MKFSTTTIPLLTLVFSALSYGAVTGTVSSGGKTVHFGEIDTQEIKVLPIESGKDVIDIKLKNDQLDGPPEQIMLSLSDTQKSSLATHYVPLRVELALNTVSKQAQFLMFCYQGTNSP